MGEKLLLKVWTTKTNKIAIGKLRSARRADTMTREQRSRCMSQIKGQDTGPELRLRRALWKRGWRFRVKNHLPGRPDLIFPAQQVAVFVDGCFWHGCPKHGVAPKSNKQFWNHKLRANIARDSEVSRRLNKVGWRVIRFWEHDVNDNLNRVLQRTERLLAVRP